MNDSDDDDGFDDDDEEEDQEGLFDSEDDGDENEDTAALKNYNPGFSPLHHPDGSDSMNSSPGKKKLVKP